MRRSFSMAAGVVLASALAGGLVGGKVFATPPDNMAEHDRVFTTALAAIENEYVEPVDSSQLVYGAIDGMLHTLDPHSSFFDPKSYAQMRERQEGSYYGLGITIASVDGDITVMSLFEGSPAYKAGIRRGDIIARITGEATKGWITDQAVAKLKGPKGTSVNISIRRAGVPALIDLTVMRDEIHITTVRTAFMMAPGTGYVRLQDFSETTDHELSDALKKLSDDHMERLILDLRDNPGGPLTQAIAVASHFLKKGQMVVSMSGRIESSNAEFPTEQDGDFTTVPLIVLVNRGTASASEIVSGAMQDHDRGLIIGEQTFGKALVQSVYSIDDAGLALTTGHYKTPSGRIIQRPWDASFDDYLLYSMHDQTGQRDHPASELHYTDAGRKVYGGGGIEPDHFIAGPIDGFNPTYFSRLLVNRALFDGFSADMFTAEGDTRPASKSVGARHKVAPGWEVTPAYVDEFKHYIEAQHMKVDEASFNADLPFIKAEMHYVVDNDLFGNEVARRNLSKVDPQVQFALGYFDEAARLLQLPKKH